MTKLKQFSNEFDVLYLGGKWSMNRGVQFLTSSGAFFAGILGKSIRRPNLEIGSDCLGLCIWPYLEVQGNKYIAQSWLDIWGSTAWMYCFFWSSGASIETRKFDWHGTLGRSGSILGLEIYFNSFHVLLFKNETMENILNSQIILSGFMTRHWPAFSRTFFS